MTKERTFTIEEYFAGQVIELRDGIWYDRSDDTVIGTEGQQVVSVIDFENSVPVAASYFLCEGHTAGSSFEDDLEGVLELWV